MRATAINQSLNHIHFVFAQFLKNVLGCNVKYIVMMLLSLTTLNTALSQDVWLQNHFTPNSGCNLSVNEPVTVLVYNNSASFIAGGSITLNYTVDAGPTISEVLFAPLSAGASWNFTFTVNANLSGCGSHNLVVWTSFAGDGNPSNNSQSWTVQNDCTIVPGSVITSSTICDGVNAGSLTLSGSSNGTISSWEYSTNGGSTWTPNGNTTTTQSYLNLTTTTQYRVQLNGGLCPNATSGVGILTVQPQPVVGTLNSGMTLCIDNASGNLNITGSSGGVNYWEYSDNSGASWNNVANTTTNLAFAGLTAERWYRAQIEGGACSDVLTNQVIIKIDNLSDGGILNMDQSICEGNTVNLNLTGTVGAISYWESSADLVSWTNISNTTTAYTTPVLTSTRYYRAVAQNGVCGADTSTVATIDVATIPVGGTLSGSTDLCEDAVVGSMTLSGYTGTITGWEFSNDFGANWTLFGNTLNNYSYLNLPDTTWFRVFFDGGACGSIYSDTAFINVVPYAIPGNLLADTTMCEGETFTLHLVGSNGSSNVWEQSLDLISWTTATNNVTDYTVSPNTSTYYRVGVANGVCSALYSDTVLVSINPMPIGGNLSGSADLCINAVSGTMALSGYSGTITGWQFSYDFGTNWTPIPVTLDNYSYLNLLDTTWFRVFFDGGICGFQYSDTAIINVVPLATAGNLLADTAMCLGESYMLNLVNSVGTSNSWEESTDLVTWNPIASNILNYTVTPTTSSYYRVGVVNGVCSAEYSDTALVTIFTVPVANAGPDVTILEGDTTILSGTGGIIGIWTPPNGLEDQNLAITNCFPIVNTTYTYSVVDANGCIGSDDVNVTVTPTFVPTIVIMNVVTTNNDSYNDYWIIQDVQYFPNTAVRVFNIYGKEVYSNDDYQNDWDATFKGKKLSNGTYYYVVTLDGEEPITGNLTLLGNE